MGAMTSSASEPAVEAARTLTCAQVKLVRFAWEEDFTASILCPEAHIIDLCLTPRPTGASGRFADLWAENRYERFGNVFMIPAGLAMEARAAAGQQRSLQLWYDRGGLSEWLEELQDWSDCQLSGTLDIRSPAIREIMMRLARELENPGFAGATMTDLLAMQLAIEVARHFRTMPDRSIGGLAPWRLRLIDERVKLDGAAPTLQELAGLVGLSVRQLTRAFRDSRGCSIGSHIEEQRIAAACAKLEKGLSIKEVAFLLGFASPSGFSHAFRGARGETPGAYRARARSALH